MPARTAAPLPPMWDAADVQPHAVDGARSLGTCLDEVGGAVGAAVVDDEDLDVRRQGRLARRPLRFDRLLPEVVEQLVERRADPFRFVICGEHQGEGHLARPSQQPARDEDTTAHPFMTEDYRAVLPRYRMVRHTSTGTMKAREEGASTVTVTAMERVQSSTKRLTSLPSQPTRAARRPHPHRGLCGRGLFLRPGHPSVDVRRDRRARRTGGVDLAHPYVGSALGEHLDLPLFPGVRPVPLTAVRPAVRGVLRPVDGRFRVGAVLARAAVAVGPADPVVAVDLRALRWPGPPVHRGRDRPRVPMAGVVGLQHPDQGHAGRRAPVVPRSSRVASPWRSPLERPSPSS